MSIAASKTRLPSAIHSKLNAVRYRHACVLTLRSALIATAVGVALLLVSMMVDWMFPFLPTWARYVSKFTTLGGAATVLVACCWSPIRNALGWSRVAGAIDAGVPLLEERWSTVANLSTRDTAKQTELERAMARQVTSEAIAMQRVVVPSKIASPASPQTPLLVATVATFVLSLWLVISPEQVSLLLHRFWSPTSTRTATQIRSLEGDRFVPRGEKIELTGLLSGIPRSSATLVLIDAEGKEQYFVVKASGDTSGSFQHSFRVEDTTSFRWVSGDGQSAVHTLNVIDYPQAAEVEFSVEFPDYIDRLPVQRDRLPRRVKVPEHSQLQIAIRPSIDLDTLQLSVKTNDPTSDRAGDRGAHLAEQILTLEQDEEGWYRYQSQLTEDVWLQATLVSPHGLRNQVRLLSKIDVIADQAPVARIISPTEDAAVAFDEQIEIRFEAHDDHGIATAELVIYDESRTDENGQPSVLATQDIELGEDRLSKHVAGMTTLDLQALGIAPDSDISYAIRVTDNRSEPSHDARPGDANESPNDGTNRTGDNTEGDSSEGDIGDGDSSKRQTPNNQEGSNSQTATPNSSGSLDEVAESTADLPSENGEGSIDTSDAPEHGPDSSDADATDSPTAASDDPASTSRSTATEPSDSIVPGDDGDPSSKANAQTNEHENTEIHDPTPSDRKEAGAAPSDVTPSDNNTNPSNNNTNPSNNNTNPSNNNTNSSSNNTNSSNDNKGPRSASASSSSGTPKRATDERVTPSEITSVATPPREPSAPSTQSMPRELPLKMQRSRSGQNTMTRRRRIQVTDKLTAIAEADDRPGEDREIRESVVEIDQMLETIESGLRQLVNHNIADSDRGEQFRRLDLSLENVETFVGDLRTETRDNQFAFVGLQMVDITRTHVAPARDRVFQAIQHPSAADADANAALRNIVRARELLAALLKSYDRVVQERRLQKQLDESVTMYEVYQQKRRMLMREARQNLNPMERKMAIVEVDQEYLDRLAEVVRLRREMMDEFARMLGDDPRLLSRYLDLVKRRGKSLRDRLTEISQRQYDATEEALGWTQIDATQRDDYWLVLSELRLPMSTDLAKDTAQLAERIEKQLPFEIDANDPLAADLLDTAQQLTKLTRQISFEAEKAVMDPPTDSGEDRATEDSSGKASMIADADQLVPLFDRLSATLDQIQFRNADQTVVAEYVEPRLLEAQIVRDLAEAWMILSRALALGNYPAIVKLEQHQLAIDTQLLRVEMLDMRRELEQQFQQIADSSLPISIGEMIETLHVQMETITFNQMAAAIRAGRDDLAACTEQQQLATERLEAAEDLFDKIRRAVVKELDQFDVQDPNIADLRDPTLDEFLAQLEREPNIVRQLGIPNRRRNLRVLSDSLRIAQGGSQGLGMSAQAAGGRARDATRMNRRNKKAKKTDARELSEQERRQREEDKKAQQALERSLAEIKRRRDDEATPDDVRQRLAKLADEMESALQPSDDGDASRARWNQIVKSDEAKQLLGAIADGRSIDDDQWNKLMSTLGDGLWQVRGKRPPEAYRKAIEQYQDQLRELTGAEW